MTRWHHGHSLGAGVAFGLILSRRPELVFAAGAIAGALLAYARQTASWAKRMVEMYRKRPRGWGRAATIPSEPLPVYRVPRPTKGPGEDIPF